MIAVLVYFPAVFCALGWLEYTLQVGLLGPATRLLGVSVWLTCLLALFAITRRHRDFKKGARQLATEWNASPVLFKLLTVGMAGIFLISALESRLPPHLPQEWDAANYHMALVRQHLLSGSFAHIRWSAADLWPLPIQMGFGPAWFMTDDFHKVPQFLTALWAFGLLLALGRARHPGYLGWVPALAVFSTQGIAIQLGIAMQDLPNLYFLIGTIHALIQRRAGWAALHLAFYASSKSFQPVATAAVVAAMLGYAYTLHRPWLRASSRLFARTGTIAVLLSCLFLARSAWVSFERAGTPLHPLAPCLFSSVSGCQATDGDAIRANSMSLQSVKDDYGIGRGPLPFLRHFWRVGVATQGVRNEYDYPLGLAWPLLGLLMAIHLVLARGKSDPIVVGAVLLWGLWWIGSQQSRWLYPTLALGWLGTSTELKRIRPAVLLTALCASAALTLVSKWRAHAPVLFESPSVIMQKQRASVSGFATLYVDSPVTQVEVKDRHFVLPIAGGGTQ